MKQKLLNTLNERTIRLIAESQSINNPFSSDLLLIKKSILALSFKVLKKELNLINSLYKNS